MMRVSEFQQACERICDRLAEDRFDPRAHEIMHSPEFLLSCAWLGLDPSEAFRRIATLAAKRRCDCEVAQPQALGATA